MKIEAEGQELVLQNSNGDTIVVPKTHRKTVMKHLQEGNYKAIDDIAESLPYMDDYAEDGTIVPVDPPKKGKQFIPVNTTFIPGSGRKAYQDVNSEGVKPYKENLVEDKNLPKGKKFINDIHPIQMSGEEVMEAKLNPNEHITNKLLTIYGEKIAAVDDPNYSDIKKQLLLHEKTNFNKDTDEIKHFKSTSKRYDKTPIHSKIKGDIFKAADEVGLDKYIALALGLVESNVAYAKDREYGKAMFTAHNATGYESPYLAFTNNSRKSSSLQGFGRFLASKKGVKYKLTKDPESGNLIPDVSSMNTAEYSKLADEYLNVITDEKPLGPNTINAALAFYKKNPHGYNSGEKDYVQTVEALAQQLRDQKF